MTLTVQMMRSAAALNVDVNVYLHIKVFVILMLGSPTWACGCARTGFFFFFFFFFFLLNGNLACSTISSTSFFKISINNTWNTICSKSKTCGSCFSVLCGVCH